MKKILSIILAAVMVFGLAACDGQGGQKPADPKLEAPVSINISSDGLIEWDAVEHATGYVLTVNGEPNEVTETHYQLDEASLNLELEFYVVAKADGYRDSSAAYGFYTPSIRVKLTGDEFVGSGRTASFTAQVEGAIGNDAVVWSISEGKDYASIDQNGVLTAKNVTEDQTVTVRAASAANPSFYDEKQVTLRSKTELTQAMLDEAATHPTVEYVGILDIDIWTLGSRPSLEQTETINTQTIMDGEYWYTNCLVDISTGERQNLHFKNLDGVANQIGLSFTNEEQCYPLLGDDGSEVSWEDAGLYNAFVGPDAENPVPLSVNDFTYDEDAFAWVYSGSDTKLAERLAASADPYSFVPKNDTFALTISRGAIVGFSITSGSDYSFLPGREARMTLSVRSNYEGVKVPTFSTYSVDDEIHAPLQAAIDNMKSLTSYRATVRHLQYSYLTGQYNPIGYYVTVTPGVVLYEDFTWDMTTAGDYIYEPTGMKYGYIKTEGGYNRFTLNKDGTYSAERAYEGSIDERKFNFDFSAALFRYYPVEGAEGMYMVTEDMISIATLFYTYVQMLDQLYGLYAVPTAVNGSNQLPSVTVENGHIVLESFYYNTMGYLAGLFEVEFDEFDTATVEDITLTDTLSVPNGWSEIPFNSGLTDTKSEYYDKNYQEAAELFFYKQVEVNIPYFLEPFGDCYMFSEAGYPYQVSSNRYVSTLATLIEAPLDTNRTLDTSIRKLRKVFEDSGFTYSRYNATEEGIAYEYKRNSDGMNIAITTISDELSVLIWF